MDSTTNRSNSILALVNLLCTIFLLIMLVPGTSRTADQMHPMAPPEMVYSQRAPEICELVERDLTFPHPSGTAHLAVLRTGHGGFTEVPTEYIAGIPPNVHFVFVTWAINSDKPDKVTPLFPKQ